METLGILLVLCQWKTQQG